MLYPFVDPRQPPTPVVDRLRPLVASVPPFDFELHRVRWFGDAVVWLDPVPDSPFRRLTEVVHATWPNHPPYEGIHDDVIPHLTVGDSGSLEDLKCAAVAVEAHLPIAATATEVWMMTGTDAAGSWQIESRFPLGSTTSESPGA